MIKHGKTRTPVYRSWQMMKDRCLNKNSTCYKEYGARGITVCDRWLDFKSFYLDMGERPANTSIDRIDNNKGYYPENCRWATRKEQSNNTRRNNNLTFNGETKSLTAWSEQTGIDINTFRERIQRGMSLE